MQYNITAHPCKLSKEMEASTTSKDLGFFCAIVCLLELGPRIIMRDPACRWRKRKNEEDQAGHLRGQAWELQTSSPSRIHGPGLSFVVLPIQGSLLTVVCWRPKRKKHGFGELTVLSFSRSFSIFLLYHSQSLLPSGSSAKCHIQLPWLREEQKLSLSLSPVNEVTFPRSPQQTSPHLTQATDCCPYLSQSLAG